MLIRYAVGEMQPLFFGYSEFVFLCFSNLVAHKFKIEDKNSHTWYIFKFKWDFTRNSIHANVKKMIGHIFFSNFKIMAKGETVFQKKFFISYIQVLIFVIIPLLLTQKLTQKFAILHTIVLVFKCKNLSSNLETSWNISLISGGVYPAGIYLFKVDNRNTRTRCEICSKLTI